VLAERLDRFARERLLKNLLATSPLFKPFDHTQQMELLKRFEGHDLEPGTVIIREGDAGQGLFVIMFGEVEILNKDAAGREKTVAKLGAGEVFGEMSLLATGPRPRPSGRCRARRSCSWAATTSAARGGAAAAAPVLRGAVEARAGRSRVLTVQAWPCSCAHDFSTTC
jgi:hypothetical protein